MSRKVKVAASVDAETAQTLRDRAALHHLSLSQVAAELLAGSVKDRSANGETVLFFAEIRQTIHRDIGRMADRLAYLLVRSGLEAGATRREVFNLLVRSGLDLAAAKRIHDAAWHAAVEALRKPVAGLRELASGADSLGTDETSDERPA